MQLALRVVLSAGLFAAPRGFTAEPGAHARSPLDAYLAAAAPTHPEYRADVRAGQAPPGMDADRLTGHGPVLGPFSYRAKRYPELTPAERLDLLRDPSLRAYLLARHPRDEPKAARPTRRFSIPPEAMLDGRPFVVPAQR